MAEELTAFRWTVPLSGVYAVRAEAFRIVRSDREVHVGEVLVPVEPAGPVKVYNPMREREADEPDLLETLARLPLEVGAFAGFASQFGLLGLDPWWVPASGRRPAPGESGPLAHGELVSDWRDALEEWRDAFALWGACSMDDTDYLGEVLPPLVPRAPERKRLDVRVGSAHYSYSRSSKTGTETIGGENSALAPLLDPHKPLRAAKLVLGELLNAKLRELTAYRVVFDAKAEDLTLRASPKSLLGAAWLRLAEAADRGRFTVRRCLRCQRWIVADPSIERRFAKIYCGAACRVAMAEKRGRARELAAEGMKPAAIAERLGQDVKVIRAWLREGGTARRKKGKE